jgi:hypothetical protein
VTSSGHGSDGRWRFLPRWPGASDGTPLKSLPWWVWAVAIIAALIALFVLVFFARGLIAVFSAYWSFGGIKRVLYQDLGVSDALSSVLATALAFIEGLVWLPVIAWPFRLLRMKFTLQQAAIAFACWVGAYGTIPVLHAAFGRDVCFNQATGAPEKWYVIRDGRVILFDSPGYDSFGVQKKVVTADVCRTHMQQATGTVFKEITDPPSTVEFFDNSTGLPKVWYDRGQDGVIHLFNAAGYDPATGNMLVPITKDVVTVLLAASRSSAASAAAPAVSQATAADNSAVNAVAEAPSPNADVGDAASAARSRVIAFVADWSEPNNAGVEAMRQYYADPVNSFGSLTDLNSLMAKNYRSAARWPVRSYTIRPDSLTVHCENDQFCTVQGMEDFVASNPANGASSYGVASFSFELRNNLIVNEDGRTLSRHYTPPTSPTTTSVSQTGP